MNAVKNPSLFHFLMSALTFPATLTFVLLLVVQLFINSLFQKCLILGIFYDCHDLKFLINFLFQILDPNRKGDFHWWDCVYVTQYWHAELHFVYLFARINWLTDLELSILVMATTMGGRIYPMTEKSSNTVVGWFLCFCWRVSKP